jgi:ectoine hydroxylase-related dioxygenase (phytanoyl-CoA dioxygenase family)
MITLAEFERKMADDGWVVFPSLISPALVSEMREDMARAWDVCREIQRRNGVSSEADLTVHHLIAVCDSFIRLLVEMQVLDEYFESYFGGKYILNSLGGAINTRGRTSYAHRIHRDIRSFSGNVPLLLNTLVMLDAFTEQNGATYMGTATHKKAERIDDEEFYRIAERALGPAGSVLVFNSNVWHAGGDNVTCEPRRSVTPMFCRPFIKPQFDYPRALGYERTDWPPYVRQLLGYNARIPASLDEWYQPPERRMYLPGQG